MKHSFIKTVSIVIVVFSAVWAALFLLLGKLHGMWGMHHENFPMMSMRLIPEHTQVSSIWITLFFVAIDGAVIGLMIAILLKPVLSALRPDDEA